MLPPQRRGGPVEWTAGVRRRHTDHSEERAAGDGVASLAAPRLAVERPVERRAAAERDAPRARLHLVDADDERPARPRTAHLDRAGQRVPLVEVARPLV